MLYELLTGHHPRDYAPHDAHSTSGDRRPSEAVVRTLTPPRGAVAAEALAERRQSTPQRLRRRLAGNLDTVVLKAIELEPERRYDSVEQFADDVRRVMAGEPVRAKPPTWTYRTRRFVRRHRLSVAAGVGCRGAARGDRGVLARQRLEIGRERDRAREAEARAASTRVAANQVADFLVGLFELAGPEKSGGRTSRRAKMLDEGAARVRIELAGAPLVTRPPAARHGRRVHAAWGSAPWPSRSCWTRWRAGRAAGEPDRRRLFETPAATCRGSHAPRRRQGRRSPTATSRATVVDASGDRAGAATTPTI